MPTWFTVKANILKLMYHLLTKKIHHRILDLEKKERFF